MARLAAAVFTLATLGAAAVGAFGSDDARAQLGTGGPACPFLALTGVPCPFCGLTRATIALGHGDVHGALGFHPLAPLVLALILGICAIVIAGRAEWLRPRRRVVALCAVIAGIWGLRFVI